LISFGLFTSTAALLEPSTGLHAHTHKHVEYNPGPIDANAGLPRASLVFTAVAFASLSVAVVMLPTQVMINGAFSFSAFHRAEQGAEEVLARTQIQPRQARPLPRRKTTQTPGGCKALGAGEWWVRGDGCVCGYGE